MNRKSEEIRKIFYIDIAITLIYFVIYLLIRFVLPISIRETFTPDDWNNLGIPIAIGMMSWTIILAVWHKYYLEEQEGLFLLHKKYIDDNNLERNANCIKVTDMHTVPIWDTALTKNLKAESHIYLKVIFDNIRVRFADLRLFESSIVRNKMDQGSETQFCPEEYTKMMGYWAEVESGIGFDLEWIVYSKDSNKTLNYLESDIKNDGYKIYRGNGNYKFYYKGETSEQNIKTEYNRVFRAYNIVGTIIKEHSDDVEKFIPYAVYTKGRWINMMVDDNHIFNEMVYEPEEIHSMLKRISDINIGANNE